MRELLETVADRTYLGYLNEGIAFTALLSIIVFDNNFAVGRK